MNDYTDNPYAKNRSINNNINHTLHHHHNINNNNNGSHNHPINNIMNNENNNNNNINTINDNMMNRNITFQRANSYLPYSHHQHDPQKSLGTIYVEDDNTHMQGIGSMLHDNISVDMSQQNEPRQAAHKNIDPEKSIVDQVLRKQKKNKKNLKKNLKKKFFGLYLQTWLIILGCLIPTITLLCYFLVPRAPILIFKSVDAIVPADFSSDKTQVYSMWSLNMTIDNSPNWIPTKLHSIGVRVLDNDTQVEFGRGNIGYNEFKPRSETSMIFNVTINYMTGNKDDETYRDLSDTCAPLKPYTTAPNYTTYLNISLVFDLSIEGIAWTVRRTIIPVDGIICPLS
ncbi:unnamed protein product [Cunninghamella blakesleeana]